MSDTDPPFADRAPFAWTFHRASSRWSFNTIHPDVDETPEPGREYADAAFTSLPSAAMIEVGLSAILQSRTSCREFSAGSLSLEELASTLFWGAGVTGRVVYGQLELLRRPAPSAGGMYPLELYAICRRIIGLPDGVYHYNAAAHGLENIREGALPARFTDYLFMGQHYATEAAATIVITGVFNRSLKKYRDRGYRYMLIEAGHIGQNISLASVAMGLGSCALGGFFDVELAQLLKLDLARELPLYAIAVGRTIGEDKSNLGNASASLGVAE